MGSPGSWGTRMLTRRRSGRTSTARLASDGSRADRHRRIAVIAPALALVSHGWNNALASLLVAAALTARFHDPQTGRILIDGTDLREVTLASWTACDPPADRHPRRRPVTREPGVGAPVATHAH
jgi:hypothetical protein